MIFAKFPENESPLPEFRSANCRDFPGNRNLIFPGKREYCIYRGAGILDFLKNGIPEIFMENGISGILPKTEFSEYLREITNLPGNEMPGVFLETKFFGKKNSRSFPGNGMSEIFRET